MTATLRQTLYSFFHHTSAKHDDSYAPQVAAQAIDFLYRSLPGTIISIVLMPILMVLIMWQQVDHVLLLVWCTLTLTVTIVRLKLYRRYANRIPDLADAPRWGRYYTYTAFCSGLLWGIAGMLFYISGSTSLQVFLYASIVGLCAGSIVLNSYWISSYYAFTLPALLLPVSRMIGDTLALRKPRSG